MKKIAPLTAGGVLTMVIVYVWSAGWCSFPEGGVRLKGRTTISSEWLEITPALRRFGGSRPCIGLFVRDSYTPTSEGMLSPAGSPIRPEVQFADLNGDWHHLSFEGFLGGDHRSGVKFCLTNDGRDYKTVRVRSSVPFRCSKITWSGEFRE
jgi:hypothetical protein